MSIIDEIKKERKDFLPKERKEQILSYLRIQLKEHESAIIRGARHFPDQAWKIPMSKGSELHAPYNMHPAIKEMLEDMGFLTRRYYNKGGIEQGMEVWI